MKTLRPRRFKLTFSTVCYIELDDNALENISGYYNLDEENLSESDLIDRISDEFTTEAEDDPINFIVNWQGTTDPCEHSDIQLTFEPSAAVEKTS